MVRRGFRVFRCRYGTKSHFVDRDWATSATADPLEVAEKWSSAEFNPCVLATGLAILDVDKRATKDGFKALAELGLDLPETFTVGTPSDGEHYYYDAQGIEFGQADLAPGINIRATNGYVVGPGSVFNGKPYVIKRDVEVAPLPAKLAEKLKAVAQRTAKKGAIVGELDTDLAVQQASHFLKHLAEPAVQGDGGDNATYNAALRIFDYGLTEQTALELMLEHYNERCSPPWELEGLQQKVQNAQQYRKAAVGRANVLIGFKPAPPPRAPAAPFIPLDLSGDERDLPTRPWMLRRKLLLGYVTMLIAPGGVGKSTLTLPWAAAVALNNGAFFGLQVERSSAVMIINKEDDHSENILRVRAMLKHFGIDRTRLAGKLHMLRDTDAPFAVARRQGGRIVVAPDVDATVAYMIAKGIKLLIVDPLVETHEANENDNNEMNTVMATYRMIARKANAAVLVVHHSSKPPHGDSAGHVGNMHSGRGASSAVNASRITLTLFNMSDKEENRYPEARGKRHRFVRLDDAKANQFLASPDAEWLERVSIQLDNGEEVGVLAPRCFGATKAGLPEFVLAQFRQAADAGKNLSISPQAPRHYPPKAWARAAEAVKQGYSEQDIRNEIDALVSFGSVKAIPGKRKNGKGEPSTCWVLTGS